MSDETIGDGAAAAAMEPVRWGVLSTAKIAREKVLPAMLKSPETTILAVASRDLAAAKRMAAELGIPRAYGSYEELLADPDIEAVYNPLPNHLHVPWTLKAAAAGKHVLCEKPIAITAAEAEALRPAAEQVLLSEAFMVRHHPQWLMAREMIRDGAVGELRAVQLFFSYFNDDPANIRNMADIGGGGLLDIGCYAIVAGRFLFEAEPRRVTALIDRDPAFGTDRTASGLADFGNGRQLAFTVSTQLAPFQRVQAVGTRGRIAVEIPFNALPGEPMRLFLDDGRELGGRAAKPIEVPACDQYRLQGEAFGRAVRGLAPLAYGLDDAMRNMAILDALRRAAEQGTWEEPRAALRVDP